MEPFLAALQSAFNLNARKGWIMLIFGAAMIFFMKVGTVPAADTQPGWFTLFVALAVLGTAILVVHFASWLIQLRQSSKAALSAHEEVASKVRAFMEEGLRNLDVLTPEETEALAWILRRGRHRFTGHPTSSHRSDGLVKKKIFHRDPSTTAADVWVVNELVWAIRSDLLKKFEDYGDHPLPPWDRGF